jgi:hypothetical protein
VICQFSKSATGNVSDFIQHHNVYYMLNEWACSMNLIEVFILGVTKEDNLANLVLHHPWWWYNLSYFIILHLYVVTHSDQNI